ARSGPVLLISRQPGCHGVPATNRASGPAQLQSRGTSQGARMKFGLLPRIILAIIAGIGLGLILPDPILGITESFRILLSGLLKFFIPLIVLAFIGAGIADFRGRVGKMLSVSVILAYLD